MIKFLILSTSGSQEKNRFFQVKKNFELRDFA